MIKLAGNWLLIKPKETEKTDTARLYVPETARYPGVGTVLAAGRGAWNHGVWDEVEFKEGDEVLYFPTSISRHPALPAGQVLIAANEIVGVIKQDELPRRASVVPGFLS